MGCYPPLAKLVSKALGKCKGRERWRERRLDLDYYAVAYPPGPPTETHYMRPVARTVTFASNNNVFLIPPQKTPPSPPQQQQEQEQKQSAPEEPPQQQQQPQTPPPQQHEPDHHNDTPPPQPQPEQPAPTQEQASDDAPPAEPKPPKGPRRGKNKKPGGRVRFGPDRPPPQEEPQQEQRAPDNGNGDHAAPGQRGVGHGSAHQAPVPASYLFRYTPSPLPRWEATPRRHEYFSGEYRSYYPTPVREGIYRIATDANRLTTIFSEENPNACTIV